MTDMPFRLGNNTMFGVHVACYHSSSTYVHISVISHVPFLFRIIIFCYNNDKHKVEREEGEKDDDDQKEVLASAFLSCLRELKEL